MVSKVTRSMNWLRVLVLVFLLLPGGARGAMARGISAPSSTTLTGWFTIVWGDSEGGLAAPQQLYRLASEDGTSAELSLSEDLAASLGGVLALNHKQVTVDGAWLLAASAGSGRSTFQVTDLSLNATDASSSAVSLAVTGSQPWISVLCKFGDITAEPHDLAYFAGMYGSSYPGLDHYWREVSYNNVNVVGSGAVGWYTLPHTRSYYVYNNALDFDRITADCTGVADSHVNFASYIGINLMFNGNLDGYAWGGGWYGTLDGVTQDWSMTWEPPWGYADITVMSHEMGHGFGLPHSSGNYGQTYDNRWDVMSDTWTDCGNLSDATYGCLGQHTISYHKDILGWIPADQKFTATPGSMTTITLEQLALPQTDNYKMAQIPIIGGPATHFYTVEVRRKTGYDVKLPGQAVIIHDVNTTRDIPAHVVDVDNNGNTGDAGAMWTVGETFTSNGISVSVIAATATGFQVTITVPSVAPVLDSYEPDNTSSAANSITSGVVQSHSIVPATDVDWVKFQLSNLSAITLETSGGTASDTRMWLYDSSLNQIEYDDNSGVGSYSSIDRQCDVDALPAGTYYVKVDESGNDNTIPAYDLSFHITQACPPPVRATGVWIADGSWNPKATFYPGDPIQWVITVENTTGSDAQASLVYDVKTPRGQSIVNQQETVTVGPGVSSWDLPGTVSDGGGNYTFTGSVIYLGLRTDQSEIYPVTACYTLTRSTSPGAAGTVTADPLPNCNNGTQFIIGTGISLTAAASTGYSFSYWSGAVVGSTNPVLLTMNGNKSVTANFTLNTYALNASKDGTGNGTVTSSPVGINCGTDCSGTYNHGTLVTLTATAATGSTFSGWSGAGCSGIGQCAVTMDAVKSVTATFTLNTYPLNIVKAGTGSGAVSSSPAGIDCGSTCSASFNYNTPVTLTAAAVPGSAFTGWSGGGCSGTGSCKATTNAAKSITATFTLLPPPSVPNLLSPAANALTTDYTPRLDWSNSAAPAGTTFDRYQVQVATDAAFTDIVAGAELLGATNSEFTPPGNLASNTIHYWRVCAYNTYGRVSAWSAVRTFRTALLPPALSAPDDGTPQLTRRPAFDWDDVPDATGYTLQVSRNAGYTSLVGTYISILSNYTPTADLPANTTLYWHVRSKGLNGPSAWSDSRSFSTPNPPSIPTLSAPANNALTTNYKPRLDWSTSTVPLRASDFDHYLLQVAIDPAFTGAIGIVVSGRTNSEYTFLTALEANTRHYWRVSSYNGLGEYSAWSVVRSFRTAIAAPTLALPANAGILTDPHPVFDWDDPAGATSYTFQVSKSSTFGSFVINTTLATSTFLQAVNLLPGQYYWRVQARGANGPSVWSETWNFTTTLPTPPIPSSNTFNFKAILSGHPQTLGGFVLSTDPVLGYVEVTGGDTAQPTTPFTFEWGDGSSDNSGFFPQHHTYADTTHNYIITITAHYPDASTGTLRLVAWFTAPTINPIALPELLTVTIPNYTVALKTRLYPVPAHTYFSDPYFPIIPRSTVEYVLSVAAFIQSDLVNGNVIYPDGNFHQVVQRSTGNCGMFSIWFTSPVSFMACGNPFERTMQYSSFFHEMGHNFTLNSPADFITGGHLDGNANAIYSETMAQIFAHATEYELLNTYQSYGLGDEITTDIETSANVSITGLVDSYNRYISSGKHFHSWNNPSTPVDETFDTFMTIAYKFIEHAEAVDDYRTPLKRMTFFLGHFNPNWRTRYSPGSNSAAAESFRATMMVAALSYGFDTDLRSEFRDLNFPINDATYLELYTLVDQP